MRARDTPWHAMTRQKSEKFSAEFDMTFTIPSRRSHLRSQFLHRKYRPQPWPPPVQALEIRRNQDATTPHGRPSVEVRRRTSLRNAMRKLPWPPLPKAWFTSESNKGVSESLLALEGKSIRVQRESPSKAAKNGSQMVPSLIALVGAIGEACGEAPACPFSGTPPLLRGAPPPDIGNRYR